MIIYEAYTKPSTTKTITTTITSTAAATAAAKATVMKKMMKMKMIGTNGINDAGDSGMKISSHRNRNGSDRIINNKSEENNTESSSSSPSSTVATSTVTVALTVTSSSTTSKQTITNESIEIFKTYESFHINADDEDCNIDDNARLPGIRIDPIGHFLFIDCINHYVEMEKLQSICCPIKSCKFLRFPSNNMLVKHVTDVHKNLFYCELCLHQRPLFIIEHRLMNKKQLQDHMNGINSCCNDVHDDVDNDVDNGNLHHHNQQQQHQLYQQQQQYQQYQQQSQQYCGIVDGSESYNIKYGSSSDASYDVYNHKGDHTDLNNINNNRNNNYITNDNYYNNNNNKIVEKNHDYCLFDEHTVAHPKCLFCNKHFFDKSALYTHMQCMYFTCHLCPAKYMFR